MTKRKEKGPSFIRYIIAGGIIFLLIFLFSYHISWQIEDAVECEITGIKDISATLFTSRCVYETTCGDVIRGCNYEVGDVTYD